MRHDGKNPVERRVLDAIPEDFGPRHRRRCNANRNEWNVGTIECRNGTTQYKTYCLKCGGKSGPLPRMLLSQLSVQDLQPISVHEIAPCDRCGSTAGSELHHWAPWHLFDDADQWPTSYLCRECHMEWHRKVTPSMAANETTLRRRAS